MDQFKQISAYSDVFGSTTKQKIYSNDLKNQNLTDMIEKHMHRISRRVSVPEFML